MAGQVGHQLRRRTGRGHLATSRQAKPAPSLPLALLTAVRAELRFRAPTPAAGHRGHNTQQARPVDEPCCCLPLVCCCLHDGMVGLFLCLKIGRRDAVTGVVALPAGCCSACSGTPLEKIRWRLA